MVPGQFAQAAACRPLPRPFFYTGLGLCEKAARGDGLVSGHTTALFALNTGTGNRTLGKCCQGPPPQYLKRVRDCATYDRDNVYTNKG